MNCLLRYCGLLAMAIGIVFAPRTVRAQCQSGWLDAPDIPATGFGTNGIVRAVVSWDPDGAGAATPVLVIGGTFSIVGGTTGANNIAMWNGSNWQAMSTGMTGSGATVIALGVFNNELIAAGTFTAAGGIGANNIARWNGSSWAPLGPGFTSGGIVAVRAMAVYNGQLHVTGSNVANSRWNGSVWTALPAGGPSGNAMAVYENELYVGGNGTFNGSLLLHRFNGTSWFTTPSGLVGTIDANDNFPFIRALAVYDNKLIVAGNFENAGPFPTCNGIVAWNGPANTWAPLSHGMDEPVQALAVYGGALYAGGNFTTAGSVLCFRVARWSGSGWSGPSTSMSGGTPAVFALGVHDNRIIAGGLYTNVNSVAVNNLGAYSPASNQWAPVANATPIRVMSGAVTAGGDFVTDIGGGVIVNRCVGWNGANLGAFSTLTGFTGTNGPIHAIGAYNPNPFTIGYTVFGGSFSIAAGATANNIATYRLSTWGTLGSGFNGTVRAIANYNGGLYAAGDFTASGAVSCLRIARYVSGAWQPVAAGFNGPVHCLFVHNGLLHAGGTFTTAGGNPCNYLAAFNGTSWSAVGDGLLGNGTGSGVYCMTSHSNGVFGPYLVVGGKFITNFSGVQNLASQGGIVFAFGGFGSHVNNTVRAATMYEGDLIIGGDFTATPGGAMNRIARFDFDGGGWQAMGSGVDSTVYALRPAFVTELHVGGAFASAGGLNSQHWARWNTTGRPALLSTPFSQNVFTCNTTFSVTPIASYTGLTYQWQRDGIDLVNGTTGHGSVISGATTPTLTMTNLFNADEGVYTCNVSNACGTTIAGPATLTVSCCSSADFDGDGDVGTDEDIEAFFACLGGNCCPTCGNPDFDRDGDTGTDADIEAFFRVLGGGSC